MRGGQLTMSQLSRWTSRWADEMPLFGGEFEWIAMHTPEWAEADETLRPDRAQRAEVIQLKPRSSHRAAA